ncbi:MAG: N-acetyltransferase family protein [Planctomycetota bacterium]
MNDSPTIRDAEPADAPAITAIYNDAIARTDASLWFEPRPESEAADKIAAASARHPYVVAESDGRVLGAAWVSPWNARDGYDRTVEFTVYIAEPARGRGIGRLLYAELIERARAADVRDIIAGLTVPNNPSERLHESMGFQRVGYFPGIAEKFGKRLDVAYFQLRLEG